MKTKQQKSSTNPDLCTLNTNIWRTNKKQQHTNKNRSHTKTTDTILTQTGGSSTWFMGKGMPMLGGGGGTTTCSSTSLGGGSCGRDRYCTAQRQQSQGVHVSQRHGWPKWSERQPTKKHDDTHSRIAFAPIPWNKQVVEILQFLHRPPHTTPIPNKPAHAYIHTHMYIYTHI